MISNTGDQRKCQQVKSQETYRKGHPMGSGVYTMCVNSLPSCILRMQFRRGRAPPQVPSIYGINKSRPPFSKEQSTLRSCLCGVQYILCFVAFVLKKKIFHNALHLSEGDFHFIKYLEKKLTKFVHNLFFT